MLVVNRCELCGRFLNDNYYKLVGCKYFLKAKGFKISIIVCPKCKSLGNSCGTTEGFIKFLEEKKKFKKYTELHFKIILRNLLALIDKENSKIVRTQIIYKKEAKDKKKVTLIVKKRVGVLNKKVGLAGYEAAEPGTVVYEINDKYVIYLRKIKPITHNVYVENEIRYYRTSLAPQIDFDR